LGAERLLVGGLRRK